MTGEFNIWEGVYDSFQEARAQQKGDGFAGDTYRSRALAAAEECRSALAKGEPIPRFHKQRSDMLPPVVAMMLANKDRLKILDFGGGLGIGYMTLLETIPDVGDAIDYHIVEVPWICESGPLLHGDAVRFSDELPDARSFDLVHSASALQYVDDWKGLVRRLCSYEPQYVLFSDVFAGKIPTFVTLQNYYGSMMPHWFWNSDDFSAFIASLGYRLEMQSFVASRRLNSENRLPMDNFPSSYRLDETRHLLFRRTG